MTPVVWPLTEQVIRAMPEEDDGRFLEFKRQWYELGRDADKAEIIRGILALDDSA